MRVSEIRVKQIRVNQGRGVLTNQTATHLLSNTIKRTGLSSTYFYSPSFTNLGINT